MSIKDIITNHETDTSPCIPLPLVHLCKARFLEKITKDGELRPYFSEFFSEELLYFFYGGAFYRYEGKADEEMAPVAFMMESTILSEGHRVMPYDTGGIRKELYGKWGEKLKNWDKYVVAEQCDSNLCINSVLNFISCVYQSHENYLRGIIKELSPELLADEEFSELIDFYKDESNELDCVDLRRCMLECQFSSPVPFDGRLLWIALPRRLAGDMVGPLYQANSKRSFSVYTYDEHRLESPQELAIYVRNAAREYINGLCK